MALFNFDEKQKTKKETCSCGCCCNDKEKTNKTVFKGECEIKNIAILGSGCKSCHELYENVKKAVRELNLNIEAEYITDMEKIVEHGVMRMPALVVNDKIISSGKVLKSTEIVSMINEFLNNNNL